MATKDIFYAWVSNNQGASDDVKYSRGTSKTNAINQARQQYGSGWTVHIMQVFVDGDGQSVMEVKEVKTFTIR